MSLGTEDFDFLRDMLQQQAGVLLGGEKAYLAESRLSPLAREHAGGDVNGLVRQLRDPARSQLRKCAVEALLIHETFFFRDPGLMQCLREQVFPDLIDKRQQERTLRIWSAACSTGQEAWSLCLMLREHFPALRDWDIAIVASDYSEPALSQARSGRYSLTDVNRGMPARMLVSWFEQVGSEWQVRAPLRDMVRFQRINLIGEWPELPLFDLVLLRNVLIYFDENTRQRVLSEVRGQLREDGFLILGGTERADMEPGFAQGGYCKHLPCYQPAL